MHRYIRICNKIKKKRFLCQYLCENIGLYKIDRHTLASIFVGTVTDMHFICRFYNKCNIQDTKKHFV